MVVDATTEWWTVECGGVLMCDVECCVKMVVARDVELGVITVRYGRISDVAIMQAVEYVKCV